MPKKATSTTIDTSDGVSVAADAARSYFDPATVGYGFSTGTFCEPETPRLNSFDRDAIRIMINLDNLN